MSRVLVVDDDRHIVRTLQIMLADDGHEVLTAGSGEEAMALLERKSADVAFVDLQLPGMSGTDLLRHLRDAHRNVETVIITAHGSVDTAVEAMKEGAFDYLTKPFSPDQVRHRLRQIERVKRLQNEVVDLKRRVGDMAFGSDFTTQDPTTLHLLEVAREVALSDATVLLTGESGTGKTLLARLIHRASPRRHGPFVTVDCTSFQETLLESELFGHRRGAYTGAVSDKPGKVETAQGGTLLLDEIGEVPPQLQGKLLRLVEERSYERLGDPTTRRVDARIIAVTNRDLEEMVRQHAFRKDLFYRLSVVDLCLPPLRNRPEDVLLLARELVASLATAHGRRVTGWDDEVERALVTYTWPGNVRELAHAIERAVLLAPGRAIRLEHLPDRVRDRDTVGDAPEEHLTLAELEERHIRRALSLNLSQDETARWLGVDPSTLWRKRKRLGL